MLIMAFNALFHWIYLRGQVTEALAGQPPFVPLLDCLYIPFNLIRWKALNVISKALWCVRSMLIIVSLLEGWGRIVTFLWHKGELIDLLDWHEEFHDRWVVLSCRSQTILIRLHAWASFSASRSKVVEKWAVWIQCLVLCQVDVINDLTVLLLRLFWRLLNCILIILIFFLAYVYRRVWIVWTIWSLLNNSYFFNSMIDDCTTLDRSLIDEVLHFLVFGAVILLLSLNLFWFQLVTPDNIPSITPILCTPISSLDLVFRFLLLLAHLLLVVLKEEGPVPEGHPLQFRCTIAASCLFRAWFLAVDETLGAVTALLAHTTLVTFWVVGRHRPFVPDRTSYHAMHWGLVIGIIVIGLLR